MNQTQTRSLRKKVLSLILAVVMAVSLLPISAFASGDSKASSDTADSSYKYNIMFLDCGRKYFSVDSIKQIIDNASAAGFNYIQLAVGNDGLRFLLDDMSLTVNGTTYGSDAVKEAIQTGNTTYNASKSYKSDKNELSESEMDAIIAYAASKGMGVIPCVNTPGHMDAILSAASSLTGTNCSYSSSARTIDVTNTTAVAFTQALLQKYITYFAGKNCKLFNMGADEYANDKFTGGSMGFGNLQSTGKYRYYVQYVNQLAAKIKAAGMTPMAFNDGIYFNNNTSSGEFDTDIVICYWSSGWSGYTPMSASDLASKGFQLINTNGSYYWILGGNQCDAKTASNFDKTAFPGKDNTDTINNPAGSMFCIWADYPGAETEESVISKTAATIAAFGKALPQIGIKSSGGTALTLNGSTELTVPGNAEATWSVDPAGVIELQASGNADERSAITGTSVVAKAVGAGTAKVTATVNDKTTYTTTLTVTDPSTVDVTVTVNGTHTETVKDVDLRNQIGTYDQTIAKVSVDCKKVNGESTETKVTTVKTDEKYYIKNSNGQYLSSDANWSDVNSAAQWTWDGSYLKNGSNYLHYSYSYYGWTTTTARRWATELYFNNGTFYGNKWSNTYSDPLGSPVTRQTTNPVDESTITFKGVAVGTTSVKIGDVTYNIIVSDKAPDDALTADTITLEHWITNARVAATSGATGDDRNVQKISKTTAEIQSKDGVAVETLAYVPGYWEKTAVHYWQAVRLDKDHLQTADRGSDQTDKGTTLTHIRYYGGAWQYETADGVWHYFLSTDHFVIYYLQKTEVTKEVDTYVKDWGFDTDKTTPDWSYGKGQVALTFAVVYPDGTVSPAEGSMYSNSTIIYNYEDGRDIGIVAPKNNSDYNISKITVTDGTRDGNSSKDVWYPYDTITWDKKTNVAGEKWYDETEVWNKSSGTTPMVKGEKSNITWSAKNTAKLVLIYLEPVEKETNLNVQYIDLNANNHVFHSYQVAMKYQSDDVPTFTKALMLDNTVIGDKGPWNSNVVGNTNYLPDEAYVTNSSNTKQTFRKDITTIPEINGIYASGLYKYMKADVSEDGKTLRLYYDLSATGGKTFVVDFGLPVEIPFDDFEITNASNVTVSFDATDTKKTERTGNYGVGKIDMTAQTVTYTLYKTLDAKAPIPVYVSDGTNTLMRSVNIIPATSVYYEDSFATFTNANGTKNVAQGDNADKGIWTKVTDGTTQTNVNQALEALGGTTNTKNVYGYDPAYAGSSKFSMGSATKVTVDANTANNGQWPTATFTFKGTGFDVISLTDNNSGAISVKVYSVGNDGTETQVKGTLVNNYYGYTCKDGKWTVTPSGDNNALYQIPVIKISGLDYGTYKVVITASYATFADKTGDGQYNFWLDAIRVYDPMGKDNATYEQDNEGYPQYIKLRDSLVGETATAKNGSVFIDGADKADIATYANYGPNNEVYLAKGQAISFKLTGALDSIASVQIGAKSPDGTDGAAVISVNGQKVTTATEMYYAITDTAKSGNQVTIANNGTGILSLTNLKITYTESGKSVSLDKLSAADQENAVAQVRALFAEPVEPFNPDRFDASWSRNVRKGETAKLTVKTSEDVEAITVNGETIDSFTERHERTGWGWWAKTVTYREFTYTDTATVTKDYTVCAVNGKGVSSDAITATLTVRPSVRDWLHGIFGKWF